MKKKSILFVCKYNNTRSRIAEFLFNKYNKNPNYKAISAGVIGGKARKDTIERLDKLQKKYKMKFSNKNTLNNNVLHKQNMIIIVADDVPIELFENFSNIGIKVIKWDVKDGWKYKTKDKNKRLDLVYKDLDKRIKKFVKELK